MKRYDLLRDVEEKHYSGVYSKRSHLMFYDVLIGVVEVRYEVAGWGNYKFIPKTALGKRLNIGECANFREMNHLALTELKNAIE